MNSAATIDLGLPISLGLHTQISIQDVSAPRILPEYITLFVAEFKLPEEKLSIQVRQIYCVHVNAMNLSEPKQSLRGNVAGNGTYIIILKSYKIFE